MENYLSCVALFTFISILYQVCDWTRRTSYVTQCRTNFPISYIRRVYSNHHWNKLLFLYVNSSSTIYQINLILFSNMFTSFSFKTCNKICKERLQYSNLTLFLVLIQFSTNFFPHIQIKEISNTSFVYLKT